MIASAQLRILSVTPSALQGYTLDRFHSLYLRGDGCWEWVGARQRRPSGALSYGIYGKPQILAHRLAFMLSSGCVLSSNQVVRHRCDNVACVRPDHLEVGTQADNLRDMRERGRGHSNPFPVGTAHPNAKVDEATVRLIRSDREQGHTLRTIGARYSLDPSTVHDIVRRRTWRNVE